jgi:hypothetical protein
MPVWLVTREAGVRGGGGWAGTAKSDKAGCGGNATSLLHHYLPKIVGYGARGTHRT